MRKPQPKTPAQIILQGRSLITARPEGMSQEEYRKLRTEQGKIMHYLFRGPVDKGIQAGMGLRKGYNYHPWK